MLVCDRSTFSYGKDGFSGSYYMDRFRGAEAFFFALFQEGKALLQFKKVL